MRNLPCRFIAVQCRSALRQCSLYPKEMKGLSTQDSGIDQVVSDLQHFLHLQRQGKRPKLYVKQKGSKNFFSQYNIFPMTLITVLITCLSIGFSVTCWFITSFSCCPVNYGNIGCGVFKGGIKNQKSFWQKIVVKLNH